MNLDSHIKTFSRIYSASSLVYKLDCVSSFCQKTLENKENPLKIHRGVSYFPSVQYLQKKSHSDFYFKLKKKKKKKP